MERKLGKDQREQPLFRMLMDAARRPARRAGVPAYARASAHAGGLFPGMGLADSKTEMADSRTRAPIPGPKPADLSPSDPAARPACRNSSIRAPDPSPGHAFPSANCSIWKLSGTHCDPSAPLAHLDDRVWTFSRSVRALARPAAQFAGSARAIARSDAHCSRRAAQLTGPVSKRNMTASNRHNTATIRTRIATTGAKIATTRTRTASTRSLPASMMRSLGSKLALHALR
jgi:hypothetical protein